MKNKILAVLLFSICNVTFSQNEKEVKKIIKDYDVNLIRQKAIEFNELEKKEKEIAYAYALSKNLPISYTDKNGNFFELMKLTSDNYPLYYSTENQAAARSTRALYLNSGGTSGLNLNGQGIVARVWDGGKVRTQHNHFGGRVASIDNPSGLTYSSHATHVTGTILASGAANIQGMAYQATARTFDWTQDKAEALTETLDGMLISNHSYGVPVTSNGTTLPSWYIGTYDSEAAAWDDIAYNAPYYLMVCAAGNSGTDNNNTEPILNGYDKLTGNKTAKNNLVVANAEDATINASNNLSSTLIINSSSSQGPTDDRRIKPDITGNGTDVLSTNSITNTSTTTMTGTSMSSPNVTGTLMLLQQYYKNVTSNFMKAATLKGLACHTADDSGRVGPDAIFGWGLLNAKTASQVITNNGLTSWISEETLTQNQTFTMNVNALVTSPIIASVTWTDVAGNANNGDRPANDLTKALVNDLDIRITKNGTTYFPWSLQNNPSLNAVRNIDNNTDNVEIIKIDNPTAGNYTISVSHKGNLVNNKQNFSLVISGITSTFGLVSTNEDQEVCSNQDAVYTFNYTQTGGATTTFSAVDLPVGATATFNPTSRNSNGIVTMTVTNLSNVIPGDYTIGIKGDNGTETETRYKKLKLFSNTFSPIVLTNPTNNLSPAATTINLTWNKQSNAQSYKVQVSTSIGFETTIIDNNTLQNSYLLTGLTQNTKYYWRILQINKCANENSSNATIYSFTTGILTCGNEFIATDFSNNVIATTNTASAVIPIAISGGFTIGDINIELDITHSYVEETKIQLQGPVSIGSPTITLFSGICLGNDNINCTVDDDGISVVCGSDPAITGTVKPQETLTSLNGLLADGTWKLIVTDNTTGDGGQINAVKIIICNLQPPLSVEDNELAQVKIFPNPTTGIVNIDLGALMLENTSVIKLYDIQGRIISTKEMNSGIETVNLSHLSNGVYMLSIENGNAKTTKKIVLNR